MILRSLQEAVIIIGKVIMQGYYRPSMQSTNHMHGVREISTLE
jgi:hypothetical protein